MELVGYSMTRAAADSAFTQAGFKKGEGRDLVGVVELHDCFSANELITYPALGLCEPDGAVKMVERKETTVRVHNLMDFRELMGLQYGGKYVVNPSGGLEAKGHPLGATGLGMHFYITCEQPRSFIGFRVTNAQSSM